MYPELLPESEIPNRQILNAANEFRDVTNLLFDKLLAGHHCARPLCMVAAFAIELYLKSLNAKNVYSQDETESMCGVYQVNAAPTKKEHSLTKLYKSIDEKLKANLREAYSNESCFSLFSTFESIIDEYDGLFVASRYSFDVNYDFGGKKGINITDLKNLVNFFGKFVIEMPRFCSPMQS
ncbi:MAG: hypothetical protein R3B84_18110 [Zavarzinella sp.]